MLPVQTKAPAVHPTHRWSLLTFHLGPVAENIKAGYANTQADFRGLANSRTTLTQPAATGQPLTGLSHLESLYYMF